jgi:hypothetical protein
LAFYAQLRLFTLYDFINALLQPYQDVLLRYDPLAGISFSGLLIATQFFYRNRAHQSFPCGKKKSVTAGFTVTDGERDQWWARRTIFPFNCKNPVYSVGRKVTTYQGFLGVLLSP